MGFVVLILTHICREITFRRTITNSGFAWDLLLSPNLTDCFYVSEFRRRWHISILRFGYLVYTCFQARFRFFWATLFLDSFDLEVFLLHLVDWAVRSEVKLYFLVSLLLAINTFVFLSEMFSRSYLRDAIIICIAQMVIVTCSTKATSFLKICHCHIHLTTL